MPDIPDAPRCGACRHNVAMLKDKLFTCLEDHTAPGRAGNPPDRTDSPSLRHSPVRRPVSQRHPASSQDTQTDHLRHNRAHARTSPDRRAHHTGNACPRRLAFPCDNDPDFCCRVKTGEIFLASGLLLARNALAYTCSPKAGAHAEWPTQIIQFPAFLAGEELGIDHFISQNDAMFRHWLIARHERPAGEMPPASEGQP